MPDGDDPSVTTRLSDDPSPGSGSLRVLRRILTDILIGAAIIVIIVAVFFLISGVWPPFVAIESGSMEPHMSAGDLVFLVEGDRYSSYEGVSDTGLVPLDHGQDIGHISFGKAGHVVVFRPNGGEDTPIIHRLHLWVEAGENWYDRANPEYVGPHSNCIELPNCPAPQDGFITKGDHNDAYDQVNPRMEVVDPDWVEGRAVIRIPYLGHFRLSL